MVAVRQADNEVWRMAGWAIEAGQLPPQKITAARVRRMLGDLGLSSPRIYLEDLALAMDRVRLQSEVAGVIKAELERRRPGRTRVVDAVTTLSGELRAKIARWEHDLGGCESSLVTEARAMLASIERFPWTSPRPILEQPWHGGACRLAEIFVDAFGDDAASCYPRSRAVQFIRRALSELGLGNRDVHTIEMALRGRSQNVRHK